MSDPVIKIAHSGKNPKTGNDIFGWEVTIQDENGKPHTMQGSSPSQAQAESDTKLAVTRLQDAAKNDIARAAAAQAAQKKS